MSTSDCVILKRRVIPTIWDPARTHATSKLAYLVGDDQTHLATNHKILTIHHRPGRFAPRAISSRCYFDLVEAVEVRQSKVVMPRATPGSSAKAGSSGTATISSPATRRISKRVATRATRQSSRLPASNRSYHGSNKMVSLTKKAEDVVLQSEEQIQDRGHIHLDREDTKVDSPAEGSEMTAPVYRSTCPITNKDELPFKLMELPTEIRLEIYRACLTRPQSILLSRQPQLSKHGDGVVAESPNAEVTNRASSHRSFTGFVAGGAPGSAPASSVAASLAATWSSTNATGSGASTAQVLVPAGASAHSNDRNQSLKRIQPEDPLLTNILRVSKEVYKEARGVLYSENYFKLDLNTAQSTLAYLHQRSRRQIKHIEVEIPSYNDILERFQETVRLSLRYCSGLKECLIHMPFMLPGADGSGTSGNTTVYANGFDILRWLPQECNIIIEGRTCLEIEQVVNKHRQLAKTLDKLAYARRQLISNENAVQQS